MGKRESEKSNSNHCTVTLAIQSSACVWASVSLTCMRSRHRVVLDDNNGVQRTPRGRGKGDPRPNVHHWGSRGPQAVNLCQTLKRREHKGWLTAQSRHCHGACSPSQSFF